MEGVHIHNGDMLFMDNASRYYNHDVVLASVDGEELLKTYYVDEEDRHWLLPSNSDYDAILLTEDTLHWLTASGDTTLALSGAGFCWLTVERGLVISADGRLQVVAVNDVELALVAAIQVKEDLSLLLEDPSALAYDDLTGRLVFPAGQRVYQYKLSGAADPKGTSLAFTDHKADDVRELRCFFLDDRLLIFTKNSAILCNENLAKQSTTKY